MKFWISGVLLAVAIAATSPGAQAAESCFGFRDKVTEAYVRIKLPKGDGSVSGTVTGTVQDDEQSYYTSWESQFKGVRKGKLLKVSVETKIEDDLQKEKKTWEMAADGAIILDGDRYEPVDCSKAQFAQ